MSAYGKNNDLKLANSSKQRGLYLFKKAVKAHKSDHVDLAKSLYIEAIKYGYRNHVIFSNLALIYKNNHKEAIKLFKKAISINPRYNEAYINLANLHRKLGHYDQALAVVYKSLELCPQHAETYRTIGSIYKEIGNLDKALAYTLKSLELNPNSPATQINLGDIYRAQGNLDQALVFTKKSLEIKPDNPIAYLNLSTIYQNIGDIEKSLGYLRLAAKNQKYKELAMIEFGIICFGEKRYREGVDAICKLQTRTAQNLLLALYLCLDDKVKFNQHAKNLISMNSLDARGCAAIDHANILYAQDLRYRVNHTIQDSISIESISSKVFPDHMIQELLDDLNANRLPLRRQSLVVNGIQTSGNIFDIQRPAYKELKKLITLKILSHMKSNSSFMQEDFVGNWESNKYKLRGWAIAMHEGGNLKQHNHEKGIVTGTFYLQMPTVKSSQDDGSIVFSHKGPNYPEGNSVFPEIKIHPKARDLNIFDSSLFHKTLPFKGSKRRICIAFDLRWRVAT